MYESFFALKEKPFSLTPNPRFLFLSKTHNEVYAHLIYGIESRAGFVEVTGEVGTGKTTILRTLLSHLDENKYRVAFIFNPKLTAFELLRNINREFGVPDDGLSSPDLIQELNSFLMAENKAGRTPILVIDEAQNLSGEVLEQIRLLSNLETEEDKLIQVILVGQPELRHHLGDHSLRQLNQRIAVRYQLRPLNSEETSSYILHRLNIAGRPDGNVFSPSALKRVFQCSSGVPRRTNLICDRALLTAYSEERGVVSVRDVNQAVKELAGMGEWSQNSLLTQWKPFAAAAAALVILLFGFLYLPSLFSDPADADLVKGTTPSVAEQKTQPDSITPSASNAQTQGVANVSQEPQKLQESQKNQAQQLQSDSLIDGCNALFDLWNVPQLAVGTSSKGFDFDREFNSRGLNLLRLPGDFDALSKFKLPFLAPLPEEQGGRYITVLGKTEDDVWSVAPAYQGRETISTSELHGLGIDMALIPWIDFASIGYVAVPGVRGENVRKLQFLLGLTGCHDTPTNGRFDPSSIECVKNFQRDNGLVVDGLVGPRTLIFLYRLSGTYKMPHL